MTITANRTRSLSIARDAMVIAAAVFAVLGAVVRRGSHGPRCAG
jgi:hypothetical protein